MYNKKSFFFLILLNNVKMYDNTIDDQTVENAAREIGVHDFISSLPSSMNMLLEKEVLHFLSAKDN